MLRLSFELDDRTQVEARIAERFGIARRGRAADGWLLDAVGSAWESRIFPHIQTELEGRLRESAEEEAIKVFGRNLNDLLLAAPAGARPTMGLDPGLRTGVKLPVVDATGKVLATSTIYPHAPKNDWNGSLAALADLAAKHGLAHPAKYR